MNNSENLTQEKPDDKGESALPHDNDTDKELQIQAIEKALAEKAVLENKIAKYQKRFLMINSVFMLVFLSSIVVAIFLYLNKNAHL